MSLEIDIYACKRQVRADYEGTDASIRSSVLSPLIGIIAVIFNGVEWAVLSKLKREVVPSPQGTESEQYRELYFKQSKLESIGWTCVLVGFGMTLVGAAGLWGVTLRYRQQIVTWMRGISPVWLCHLIMIQVIALGIYLLVVVPTATLWFMVSRC